MESFKKDEIGTCYVKKEDGKFHKLRMMEKVDDKSLKDVIMVPELTEYGLMIPIGMTPKNNFGATIRTKDESVVYILLDNDTLDLIGKRIEERKEKPKKKGLFSFFKK